jgi:hypothetical protein
MVPCPLYLSYGSPSPFLPSLPPPEGMSRQDELNLQQALSLRRALQEEVGGSG